MNGTNPVEKLQDAGVTIIQEPLVTEAAATGATDTVARLSAEPTEDGYAHTISLHENLPIEDIEMIAEWADQLIERLAQHGPVHDGWAEEDDGTLELWLNRSSDDAG